MGVKWFVESLGRVRGSGERSGGRKNQQQKKITFFFLSKMRITRRVDDKINNKLDERTRVRYIANMEGNITHDEAIHRMRQRKRNRRN
jgi:hypothetical protein